MAKLSEFLGGKMSSGLLKWRKRKKRGEIMKSSTFEKIKESATKRYGSEERGKKVAGSAYWKTALHKYLGKEE